MRVMRDFKCTACEKITEKFIDSEIDGILCDCGSLASRIVSCPRPVLDGTSGDFPGAAMRWAKIREDNARIKAKRES